MTRHNSARDSKQIEPVKPLKKHPFAIASMVSAVIGLFIFPIFFAPMAIVCGLFGFTQASPRTFKSANRCYDYADTQAKDRKNRKWSLIGAVLGIIEICFLFIMLKG